MKTGDVIHLRGDENNEYRILECLTKDKARVVNIWTGAKREIRVKDVQPPQEKVLNFGPGW